jgi:hypothetical protein
MAQNQPWWGKNALSGAQRWLGRNRPATGGGAVKNVGSKAPTVSAPKSPPGQFQAAGSIPALSINPHATPLNATIASADAEHAAPSNSSFNGLRWR